MNAHIYTFKKGLVCSMGYQKLPLKLVNTPFINSWTLPLKLVNTPLKTREHPLYNSWTLPFKEVSYSVPSVWRYYMYIYISVWRACFKTFQKYKNTFSLFLQWFNNESYLYVHGMDLWRFHLYTLHVMFRVFPLSEHAIRALPRVAARIYTVERIPTMVFSKWPLLRIKLAFLLEL